MRNSRIPQLRSNTAFTLLELILVMVILAIAAALIVPSLRGFAISRATDGAAMQVLTLSQYARTQAVNEGRIYHLNFDPSKQSMWLTALDANTGNFLELNNDFGNHYTLPPEMTMTVDVVPMPSAVLMVPVNVQQNTTTPMVPFGQPVAEQSNPILQNVHADADGTYMEFQPSGRVDPVHVQLIDKLGKVIDLGCATSTESMHILTAQEMR